MYFNFSFCNCQVNNVSNMRAHTHIRTFTQHMSYQLSHETPNYTSIIDNVFFINTTYSISLRNNDNM